MVRMTLTIKTTVRDEVIKQAHRLGLHVIIINDEQLKFYNPVIGIEFGPFTNNAAWTWLRSEHP